MAPKLDRAQLIIVQLREENMKLRKLVNQQRQDNVIEKFVAASLTGASVRLTVPEEAAKFAIDAAQAVLNYLGQEPSAPAGETSAEGGEPAAAAEGGADQTSSSSSAEGEQVAEETKSKIEIVR